MLPVVCLAVDVEDSGNVKEPGPACHTADWQASNGSVVNGVETGTCAGAEASHSRLVSFHSPLEMANEFPAHGPAT